MTHHYQHVIKMAEVICRLKSTSTPSEILFYFNRTFPKSFKYYLLDISFTSFLDFQCPKS